MYLSNSHERYITSKLQRFSSFSVQKVCLQHHHTYNVFVEVGKVYFLFACRCYSRAAAVVAVGCPAIFINSSPLGSAPYSTGCAYSCRASRDHIPGIDFQSALT